jgi:hypothetical protein
MEWSTLIVLPANLCIYLIKYTIMPPDTENRIVFNIQLNRIVSICTIVGSIGGASLFGLSKANKILMAIEENISQTIQLRRDMDDAKKQRIEHDKEISYLKFKNNQK